MLGEPTNDLDTDTLAALEDLLDGWPGTLVVASHDRYLLERVTDDAYALFGDGGLTHLPGGVEEYLARVATPARVDHEVGSDKVGIPRRQAHDQRQLRRELARLERQVGRLEEQEARLHEELVRFATDHEKLAELDARLREVRAQRERTEEAWLTLADRASGG